MSEQEIITLLLEHKNGLNSYQVYDLLIKLVSSIAVLLGALAAWKKYRDEKHREIYEKRLNEVYAPLYGLIVKQETLRDLLLPDSTREKEPILHTVITTKHTTTGSLGISYKETKRPGEVNRDNLIETFDKINKGLARPKLLKLFYQYKTILAYEVPIKTKYENAFSKIESQIINEIEDGYIETIKKLGLDCPIGITAEFDAQLKERSISEEPEP